MAAHLVHRPYDPGGTAHPFQRQRRVHVHVPRGHPAGCHPCGGGALHWHVFLSVVSGHIIVIAGYVRIFGENVTSIKFLVWKPWENMNQHIHGAMKV